MNKRRRWLWIGLTIFIVAVILLAPLWLGYFGPKAASWAATWRPWRTDYSVTYVYLPSDDVAYITVEYEDWLSAQDCVDAQVVERADSLLPWRVTEHCTGI
jgi:hypothetical protein